MKRKIRTIVLATVIYVVVWVITATIGTRDIHDFAAREFMGERASHIPQVDWIVPATSAIEMPFYCMSSSSPAPLIIRVRYSLALAPLGGEGGYCYFLWFFGIKSLVHKHVVVVS